jgi:hypothetical protein
VLKWVCRNYNEFKNPNPEYKLNQESFVKKKIKKKKKKKRTKTRSRSRCCGNEPAENVIAGE